VQWPTSKHCADIGLLDTYFDAPQHARFLRNRFDASATVMSEVVGNGGEEPIDGRTWSTLKDEYDIYDRIDFIYMARNANAQVLNSFTLVERNTLPHYPSDHRAVVTDLTLAE
jgi:hypothetical protein